MTTINIWLLIAISSGGYNQGTVTVVERFADLPQCQHVLSQIRETQVNTTGRCINANVLKERP